MGVGKTCKQNKEDDFQTHQMEFAIEEESWANFCVRHSLSNFEVSEQEIQTRLSKKIRRSTRRKAKLDRIWTSVDEESAWIRTCAKYKAKHRPVLYGPKTGGNVTSPCEEEADFFLFFFLAWSQKQRNEYIE